MKTEEVFVQAKPKALTWKEKAAVQKLKDLKKNRKALKKMEADEQKIVKYLKEN